MRGLVLPTEPVPNAEAMAHLGASLADQLQPGDILALHGELGTGKTTLVRGLAAALGVPAEDVSSPTFALVHLYHGHELDLLHADLYRLDDAEELLAVGLDEQWADPTRIAVVEWPEIAAELLPPETLHLRLAMHPQGRTVTQLS